jgi:hypothetical protein
MFPKELYNGILNISVSSVMKTVNSNIWDIIVKLFFKYPGLPVKVTLNRNYPR